MNEYDEAGHLKVVKRQQRGVNDIAETRYTYNDREQVTRIEETQVAGECGSVSPAPAQTDFTYKPGWGTLQFVDTPSRLRIEYRPDSAGRVASVKRGDSGARTFGYDKAGRLTYATDGHDGVLTGQYDSLGRLTHKRYYRSRVTATYQRAVADYEAQGLSPQRVGKLADKATKRWATQNLKDFSQTFDPQTRRTYSGGHGAAQPDILLPKYGEEVELKTTFDAAWRAETQYGRFIDLFPEYNIEYVLEKGGWVSSSGTPISVRSYLRSVLAAAVQQGANQ